MGDTIRWGKVLVGEEVDEPTRRLLVAAVEHGVLEPAELVTLAKRLQMNKDRAGKVLSGLELTNLAERDEDGRAFLTADGLELATGLFQEQTQLQTP